MSGSDQGRIKHGPEALGRDGAGLSEGAPDVLVVDERLD